MVFQESRFRKQRGISEKHTKLREFFRCELLLLQCWVVKVASRHSEKGHWRPDKVGPVNARMHFPDSMCFQ